MDVPLPITENKYLMSYVLCLQSKREKNKFQGCDVKFEFTNEIV
jgi:hypothetical protein